MTRVVCVGDLMVDVLVRLPGPLAPGSDTPAPVTFQGGGAAANVAAWVVEAGGDATFVGRVGTDPAGAEAVAALRAAGVRTSVEVDPDRPTGACVVLVDPDGERTMIPSAGANGAAADTALLPPDGDWLYLSGYSLLNSGARPFALAALSHARERRWSIAVDAASAAPLAEAGAAAFLDWVGPDVLLLANLDEALTLTGRAEAAAAAQALAARSGLAVVKRGAAGAVWSDGAGVWSAPAAPADVVDTTGAGDAFAAGFLAAVGEVGDCLKAAAALAARAVAQLGARPSPVAQPAAAQPAAQPDR
ncbi:carbohydrate kinase family protein [uncultured Jatrophihabitans sp.]|uniref:carbohydrate kinase family protein n=1 Tax=uncultured Jatrophihabitans sp. TaxID=1610747 RepID=UPI0035CC9DCD